MSKGHYLKFERAIVIMTRHQICAIIHTCVKVTFARNLAKKLSLLFYYLILLFQLSVANPENFEEFKAREVLKIRKEKTGISPTSLVH